MSLRNVLFIGCGGSAGRIISMLKNNLKNEEKSNNLHYLVFDLEPKHITGYENLDSETEYCFFGGINPREFVSGIIKRGESSPDYRRLSEYFPIDLPQFLEMLPDRKMEKGAGRKRMVGRLLAYANQAEIKRTYNLKLRELQKSHQSINPNVVVISSCCGGTGSSIFYDILNLSAAKSINLFPVVIGPSFLVNENELMLTELGEKIRMNTFAFFEEFSVYNNYPNINFSFFRTSSTRLNLPFIYFFDNLLSESEVIATDNYEFEAYVATCLGHIFKDSPGKLDVWETKKEIKQNFGSTLENVLDDILNQPRKVFSEVVDDHREKANFISFSYFETPNRDRYLEEILQTLIAQDSLPADKQFEVNDLIQAIDPRRNSETIKFSIDNDSPETVLRKFVEPYTESKSSKLNFSKEKVLRLVVISDYLSNIHRHLTRKTDNNPVVTPNASNNGNKEGLRARLTKWISSISLTKSKPKENDEKQSADNFEEEAKPKMDI